MAEHTSAHNERSSTIVVASALAAQQWEMHLADARIAAGAPAWETPPLKSYAAWLDELWLEHADDRPALSTNQSLSLWRRVVAESAKSGDLIGHAGAAEWAAGAWGLLHRWQIDPDAERAATDQVDYRAFLAWSRRYRAWLDGHGFLDRAELEAAATRRVIAPERLRLADLDESYPARTALFQQLTARGTAIETLTAPTRAGTPRAARLADAAEELRAAFAWAAQRLTAEPFGRIAIIVPTAARRAHELERLAAELPEDFDVGWTAGRTLAADAALGAALDALALATAHAPYASFGRWLRSPFFNVAGEERFARTRLDADLRTELRSRLSFEAAYRCGVAELLDARAPASARSLAAALATVGGTRRATPSRWAHLFTRFLTALGWQAPAARAVLLAWQSTLDELSRLTPIVGEISLDGAVAEVARLLERATPALLPVRGVHVLERIADVGPGYDAVWVTGFTDAAWPEPPRGNPLLPVALQRAHAMPYSSPRDAQERSARALERLVLRSRELVISWPARVYDYETEASPAIREWPQLAPAELDGLTVPRPLPVAARQTLIDDAPPLGTARVAGGAGALGRQARCPLRAFFQDRLGARPLEPLGFGVPARLRGIAAHRAAERLLDDLPTQASFAAKPAAVAHCVERALAKLLWAYARAACSLVRARSRATRTRARGLVARGSATRAVSRVGRRATHFTGRRAADIRRPHRPRRRAGGWHAGRHRLQDGRAGDERGLVRRSLA